MLLWVRVGVVWVLFLPSIVSLGDERYRLKYFLKGLLNQKKKKKRKQPTNYLSLIYLLHLRYILDIHYF